MPNQNYYDVIIVGAGISGISAAYHLKTGSPNHSFIVLEGRDSIGGTWDLFRYPGIRSDSDMYTLGFRFRPWTNPKAIADGPAIMDYLNDTIAEFDLDQYIQLGQKVIRADWSSKTATWTLTVHQSDKTTQIYTCNFLHMCSGYYNYEHGYMPDFTGVEHYQGKLIHPQHWPEQMDYADKKIVVIGSGATAVTLVPELAKKAAKVTMLQRSPTYVVSAPEKDKLANFTNKILPTKLAYSLNRWRKILLQLVSYQLMRAFPNFFKKLIVKGAKKELEDKVAVEPHFTPRYNPWDQRVCLVPDGDLFEVLKTGRAAIVTDHIKTFTKNGLLLKSGKELEADIIVSATGLEIKILGGLEFRMDGELVDFSKTVSYKSMMFSNVPNMALSFGYTNASWTLKCDLTSHYVSRLVNYMWENDCQIACPRFREGEMELLPWLDFTSGYIQRHIHLLPKQGAEKPWKLKQNYLFDRMTIEHGKLDDGVMAFSKVKKEDAPVNPVPHVVSPE